MPLVASCTILCELRSESDKLSPTRYRDIDSKRKTLTERFFRLICKVGQRGNPGGAQFAHEGRWLHVMELLCFKTTGFFSWSVVFMWLLWNCFKGKLLYNSFICCFGEIVFILTCPCFAGRQDKKRTKPRKHSSRMRTFHLEAITRCHTDPQYTQPAKYIRGYTWPLVYPLVY